MIKVKEKLQDSNSRLIGPNCPGIITLKNVRLVLCQDIFIKKELLVLYQDLEL